MFGLVQVWSGYFLETHSGVFAHASPATMAYDSPIDYVRTMRAALRRFALRRSACRSLAGVRSRLS